ncbi:MAG: ATP-binding cassette domain-containing protein [Bacteroidales bacterium]|nr:ATP-binding cassette domain-containing protein [Bacteroidales bacterium]
MFEDKLIERYEGNKKALDESMNLFRSLVNKEFGISGNDNSKAALSAILQFFKLDKSFVPDNIGSWEEVQDFLKAERIFCHKAKLEGKWWKNAVGPVLTRSKSGELVALIPSVFGYRRYYPQTGKKKKVNSKVCTDLEPDALNFFNSLPRKKLELKDLISFAIKSVPVGNYILVGLICIVAALLSLLVPVANKIMFSEVVPSGSVAGILPICMLLLGAGVSSVLFSLARNFILVRMKDKINATVQPALFGRLLSLPASFFRTRSASDLSARVLSANKLYQLFTSHLMGVLVGGVFSILYILVAFMYAREMLWVVTAVLIANVITYILLFKGYTKESEEKLEADVISQEFTFGALSGIHKVKNNRAEFRVYSQWLKRFCAAEHITARTPALLKIGGEIGKIICPLGFLAVWIVAARSKMLASDYMAFMSAFGMMEYAINALAAEIHNIAETVPVVKLTIPLLEEEPEVNKGHVLVSNITGSIDINHVTFSYASNSRKILDDVSLHIRSGENIGLVGASGCGKSTLMRIMLGFEKPSTGSVFYGQYNLESVNMGSLRQYVGYCPQAMQVFPGTIADNIRLAKPTATDEDVWEAARIASLDEDIKRMPLQMDTPVGEGGSGLSGGQCQRLLIARSVINRPKVLFFDEATAALDNITQHNVVQNLAKFGCTRISIAHRLSTIMDCDRIIVLDKGRIVEEGSPKELLEKQGFFYKLSIRQM